MQRMFVTLGFHLAGTLNLEAIWYISQLQLQDVLRLFC